ncbi:hypothetical protein [Lachnobacterium bovis]|uniref:hypothetical protein n=1 Tax=Lachnobacterium bovis TaxID=140626 RepID=UPI00048C6EAF|nr:hypothetical protein [Lachnobacterium bovis]
MRHKYRIKREKNNGDNVRHKNRHRINYKDNKINKIVHIYTSDYNIKDSLEELKYFYKFMCFFFPVTFGLQSAVEWDKGNIINRIFDGVAMCIVMALLTVPMALVLYGIVWIGLKKFHRLVIQVSLDDIEESYLRKGRKEIPLKELKFKAYRRSPLRKFDTIKGFRNGSKLSCVRICEAHMPDEFYTLVSYLTTMNLIINPTELKEFSPYYYKYR